jgi:hypothetical protein
MWILVTKLAPQYYRKLDLILHKIPRHREPASWRKAFKKEWKRCSIAAINGPVEEKYRPNTHLWVCSCPYFVRSRFLVCKHLVQSVEPVPPAFFWEVRRRRTRPFWKHRSLIPLNPEDAPLVEVVELEPAGDEAVKVDSEISWQLGLGTDADSDSEDEDNSFIVSNKTFQERMTERIQLLNDFAKGLEHQIQFNDTRFLNTLEREGAAFFRLAGNCLDREKRANDTRMDAPRTYERQTSNAMFWRPRPAREPS